MNLIIIAYASKPGAHERRTGYAGSFVSDYLAFKTRHDKYLLSEYKWPSAIKVNDPALYNYKEKNMLTHLIFLYALRFAIKIKASHFMFVEQDCRMAGDYWDVPIADEFLAHDSLPRIAGTTVLFNNDRDYNLMKGVTWFIQNKINLNNKGSVIPYWFQSNGDLANKGCKGIYVNGALGIFDVNYLKRHYGQINIYSHSHSNYLWDIMISKYLYDDYGSDCFKHAQPIYSIWSMCNYRYASEGRLIEMLKDRKIMAAHQIKSDVQMS